MEASTNPMSATPRQIAYARSLALRNQTLLPWEVQQDRRSLSAWIDAQAQIVGGPVLDPLTAQQLFLDATSYRRLIVDPVSGVPLDLDRRRYRPTRSQRDLLVLRHGTCSRDGCDRLAVDAEIDHILEWRRGGPTELNWIGNDLIAHAEEQGIKVPTLQRLVTEIAARLPRGENA